MVLPALPLAPIALGLAGTAVTGVAGWILDDKFNDGQIRKTVFEGGAKLVADTAKDAWNASTKQAKKSLDDLLSGDFLALLQDNIGILLGGMGMGAMALFTGKGVMSGLILAAIGAAVGYLVHKYAFPNIFNKKAAPKETNTPSAEKNLKSEETPAADERIAENKTKNQQTFNEKSENPKNPAVDRRPDL